MIYLVCIGGLLMFNAWVVMLLWNKLFHELIPTTEPLNFLEGAGITAFAYVIVFTVRYGRAPQSRSVTDTFRRRHTPPTTAQTQHHTELSALCSSMTAEERTRLKNELVTKAGCRSSAQRAE